MAHFAKVEGGVVTQVIVAEQDFIDSGLVGDPTQWVQTSYNTKGGYHYTPDGSGLSEDQSKALRKNFAGIGYTYDVGRDAFIPPRPFPSWALSDATCLWEPPTPRPTDGSLYVWDEATLAWISLPVSE